MKRRTGAGLLAVAAVAFALTAGAQAERRAIHPTVLTQPAWSPDGRHVAWVAGPPNGYGTVWVADASGRNAQPLHQFGHSLLDGVDGVGQIAWATPTSLLVDARLNGVVQLFRLTLHGRATVLTQLSDLNFSTDRSRRLVATTGYSDTCGSLNCPAPIDILDTTALSVTAVGSPGEADLFPALAPDGRRVAYDRAACSPTGCGQAHGVWLRAASGKGGAREIVHSGEYPVWSPDGRLIAYIRPWRNHTTLLQVLRLGGKPRSFASHATPLFSPDSRFLAYSAGYGRIDKRTGSSPAGVAVVDLRTRRMILRPKTFQTVDTARGAWSPDGTELLVSARTASAQCDSLWITRIRSGRWRPFRSCG